MHACWLLVTAERTLPAELIYGHPPRVVGQEGMISTVDLESSHFPEIKPPKIRERKGSAATDDTSQAIRSACDELGILGNDPQFATAVQKAARVAPYPAHVLILGETGTGKELIARLIHDLSTRSKQAYVPVNCAALPGEIAESILFGHQKGSFTGAHADKQGLFLSANGGTLFLDEIGDMAMHIQAKMLRALESGSIEPVGANKPIQIDTRVVAATNADLTSAIADGNFRQDLVQRFVTTITLPPLRQRRSDIPLLANAILDKWNRRHNKRKQLSTKALAALTGFSWPGNIRQLKSVIETGAMTSDGDRIQKVDLDFNNLVGSPQTKQLEIQLPHEGFDMKKYLADIREQLVYQALEAADGNQAQAARLLGISQQAVGNYANRRHRGAN
jgi:two-component system response regulator PilR (NtrC family)